MIGKRHFGRKAMAPGGDGGRAPTRELFDTLVHWNPRVVLDTQGRASRARDPQRCIDCVSHRGRGRCRIGHVRHGRDDGRSVQDLGLIGGLPAVAREGDAIDAGFTLRNTTKRAMRVRVEATASGSDAAG